MTDLQTLFRTVDELSAEELKALYAYITQTRLQFSDVYEPRTSQPPPRILGLHAHLGEAWLAEDFNAELPDSFWLGES